MITLKQKGNLDSIEKFLKKSRDYTQILNNAGVEGVRALALATPIDSGETANSWAYEIKKTRFGYRIIWTNDNIVDGIPVAILIQYGHGTRNGSFVEARDFINPAMKEAFDKLAENLYKEVSD